METFLTCRKLAEYLRQTVLNDRVGNFFEEMSLQAIYRTLNTSNSVAEFEMLFSELPKILPLNYPVVNDIRKACINILEQLPSVWRKNDLWQNFSECDYLLNMLKAFDAYKK